MRTDRDSVFRASSPDLPSRLRWRSAFAGVLLFVACACLAQDGQAPSANPGQANAAAQPSAPNATNQEKAAVADSDRKKRITDESSQLLAMAIALKAEVDKSSKDTLSLNVIRKADEIERLAHIVKEKTKQSGGSS
jgi:hypothetical protein